MRTPDLFDVPPELPKPLPHHDGATYDPDRDKVRLNAQTQRVFDLMKAGTWLTLHEISVGTGDPEASVSARLRDLRKTKFGGHEVERQNLGGGRWVYRLVLPGEAVHESVQRDDDHPHAPEINEDHEGGEHLAEF